MAFPEWWMADDQWWVAFETKAKSFDSESTSLPCNVSGGTMAHSSCTDGHVAIRQPRIHTWNSLALPLIRNVKLDKSLTISAPLSNL